MAKDGVTLEVDYKPRDFRPYLYKSQLRSIVMTAVFIFVSLLASYAVASRFIDEAVSERFRLVALAFLILVPLVAVVINLVAIERDARRKSTSTSVVVLEVNREGVTSREEFRTATLQWGAYEQAVEFKDKFVLVGRKGGLLIPKRCFEDSAGDMEDFRDLVVAGLNKPIEQR